MTLTTDGEFVWNKSVGSTGQDFGYGVALDSSENVVIVGEFVGTVSFGLAPLVSAGSSTDIFVAKYARATGTHLFSKRYGGTEGDMAFSVTVDSMDNIIIAGSFSGAVDFGGPVPLVATDSESMFIAKYTLAGAYLWAKAFRATGVTTTARSVALDDAGDVVLTGEFCGTISFGGAELSSANECLTRDVFAVRLAGSNGGHLRSLRAGSRADVARIALAPGGRAYLVGYFYGFADIGGHGLTPVNGVDSFILALAPL